MSRVTMKNCLPKKGRQLEVFAVLNALERSRFKLLSIFPSVPKLGARRTVLKTAERTTFFLGSRLGSIADLNLLVLQYL